MDASAKLTRIALAAGIVSFGFFSRGESATPLAANPYPTANISTQNTAAAVTIQIMLSGERSIFYGGFQ